jgi:very-short-patch-repair endonuclease
MTHPLPPGREGSTRRGRAGEGMSDKAYDRLPTLRSRELRKNATKAELALWNRIRNRQVAGVRFNFQVPIGPYISDFVARSIRLIIEVDGGQHADAAPYDRARTRFLTSKGYRVIRFWNNDVFENIEGAVETIARVLEDMPSPTPPDNGRGS